jgi:hypothetical protein
MRENVCVHTGTLLVWMSEVPFGIEFRSRFCIVFDHKVHEVF